MQRRNRGRDLRSHRIVRSMVSRRSPDSHADADRAGNPRRFSRTAYEQLAARMANARVCDIDAGHLAPMQHPDRVDLHPHPGIHRPHCLTLHPLFIPIDGGASQGSAARSANGSPASGAEVRLFGDMEVGLWFAGLEAGCALFRCATSADPDFARKTQANRRPNKSTQTTHPSPGPAHVAQRNRAQPAPNPAIPKPNFTDTEVLNHRSPCGRAIRGATCAGPGLAQERTPKDRVE